MRICLLSQRPDSSEAVVRPAGPAPTMSTRFVIPTRASGARDPKPRTPLGRWSSSYLESSVLGLGDAGGTLGSGFGVLGGVGFDDGAGESGELGGSDGDAGVGVCGEQPAAIALRAIAASINLGACILDSS